MSKYFPNKWKKYADIPADRFQPLYYEDVMEWKVAGWELPTDVACVIRARNLENSKVTEHVYKRMSYAENNGRRDRDVEESELISCAEWGLYYVHEEL